MVDVCDVLMYFALAGKIWEYGMRFLPVKTCPPTPIRNIGLVDQAGASRASLIAPSTLLRSVSVTVSFVAPTVCTRSRLVSSERSRNVEELSPSVQSEPIG